MRYIESNCGLLTLRARVTFNHLMGKDDDSAPASTVNAELSDASELDELKRDLEKEISARRQTENALRRREEHFQVALEGAGMAAWDFDVRSGRVTWNDQHFHLFGLEPDEEEKTPDYFMSFVHPDDAEMVRQRLRTAVEESGVYRAEFRIVRADNHATHWMTGFGKAIEWQEGKVSRMTGVMSDITERRRAEEELRKSEERFRAVTDNVAPMIWTNSVEDKANYFNRRMYDYSGLSYDDLVGGGWEAMVHPDDAPASRERWRQALAKGEIFEAEYRLRRADGEHRWFIGRNIPLRDNNGHVTSWFGSATDIHDLKAAGAALRASEARFRAMFEQANVGIVQIDSSGRFLSVNPGFCAIVGYTEEELRMMKVPDVTDHDDWQKEEELTQQLIAGDIGEYTIEKRYRRKDGAVVWGSMTATMARDESGRALYTLAIVQAITERKQAEEQLRFSEERFRQFAENSADLFWIVDVATQRIEYLNPVFETMWGEPRETVIRDINRWSELVHPDDREHAASAMPRTLGGETVTVEYRIVRPCDGTVRWLRDMGFPIRDENGRITRVAGVARDVTEDKQRNAALRENEERYRLLVDGARDYAIFLLNPSNEIVYWSAGAERVFGWSAEEAVGQSGELVFTPEDRAREQEEKEIETALGEGCASDRRWHIRKDGTRIWVDGVMRRLDDEENGALRGFAKIARDATEQRRAEDELHRAHEELEQRVRERTAELRAKNRLLQSEIGRRQMLEREILRITERERARIGQDLHDSLCQELTATAFLLKSRAKAISAQSKPAADSLTEAAETVNANAGLARDLARGLHPFELGAAGLPSALRELCGRTNESISCRCDCPRSLRLDQNVAVNLYRIAQEAILNAVKHAKASEIVVVLERTNGDIVLTVSDDGKGTQRRARGLGTHIMEYRARAAGGTLQVESTRGRGTSVTCRVPLKK